MPTRSSAKLPTLPDEYACFPILGRGLAELAREARGTLGGGEARRDQGSPSMLAMNYRGPYRVRADEKPMPRILHAEDAVVRVTRSCICGSDLHLYHGMVPDTRVGMTFGHEFCGIVEEIGPEVRTLKRGDHVLVPFNIACGKCHFCQQGLFGNCHESNAQATAVGGIYGYSHTAAAYDGGQAQYARVPYADVGPTVIPEWMDPDDAVLLTDVVPTGYQAAEMGGI